MPETLRARLQSNKLRYANEIVLLPVNQAHAAVSTEPGAAAADLDNRAGLTTASKRRVGGVRHAQPLGIGGT